MQDVEIGAPPPAFGSHLLYYFALVWGATLLTMVIALFFADLIIQSILQAEVTPFPADHIVRSELSGGSTGTLEARGGAPANVDLELLTTEQRHSLKWVQAVFMVGSWIALVPAAMSLPTKTSSSCSG